MGGVVASMPLYNEDEILRKDLRIGDTILIQRAGDVIPQVISVDLTKEKEQQKIYFSQNCLCGAPTLKEISKSTRKQDAVRRCVKGYDCEHISREKLNILYLKRLLILMG